MENNIMKKNYEGLYLVEYSTDWDTGRPIIWLFSRLKNGEKKIEKITDFKPYFYVEKDTHLSPSLKIEGEYTSIFGDKLKKVIVNSPKDIYPLRQMLEAEGNKHFEADILFNNRFLIDNVEEIEKSNYKKFVIDIETLSEGGFPDVDKAQQPIVCLTIYNSFTKKYITWIWREDFGLQVEQTEKGEIRKFSNEKSMLQNLINYIKIESPDIFLGWNLRFFDMKYLINRMQNIFKLNVRGMSPMNATFITRNERLLKKDRTIKFDEVFPKMVSGDQKRFIKFMDYCFGE